MTMIHTILELARENLNVKREKTTLRECRRFVVIVLRFGLSVCAIHETAQGVSPTKSETVVTEFVSTCTLQSFVVSIGAR